jgi:hypothetical protein
MLVTINNSAQNKEFLLKVVKQRAVTGTWGGDVGGDRWR